jgi:hypothetical protein
MRWKFIGTGGIDGLGLVCAIANDDSVFCGSKLQAKQTLTEPLLRLGGVSGSVYSGFGMNVCGLSAAGDVRCADSWAIVTGIPVKVKATHGTCVISTDAKVYCKPASFDGAYTLVPGQ